MGQLYENILGTIGRTPVVRINRLAPEGVNLFAKIESFNPMASVKDRLALGIIEAAERAGELKPGQTVVEATSGNTGIGLAMVCAQKGYPLVVTMAESFSVERRKMMRFLGAKVILTPAGEKGTGMLAKAVELSEKHGWFLCRQFENEANADMHSRTTAVEILEDFDGRQLDYWVTGYGTGGTLKGVARVLKERSPETKVIVCEPDNSPLLGSGIAQPKNADGSASESHPSFRPHLMQGWTPDFIPELTGDVVDLGFIDRVVPINGEAALRNARELALQEGIFVGTSSGATLTGAISIAEQASRGSNILCMLPDTGERYMTTPLFEPILADMSDEEWQISRSTPACRFDAQAVKPSTVKEDKKPATTEAADAFVEKVLADSALPVAFFALEWCEFCWSVRKFFAACGIPYRAIDLDSVEYQKDNWGGQIRATLHTITGSRTIPQVFVGGQHIGGCTEVFDAFRAGELQVLLCDRGVDYDKSAELDPYTLLPAWLQKR